MSEYPNLAGIHITAEHCAAAGLPLPEKTLRRFVKSGTIAAVWTGKKYLLLWDNVISFMRAGNNNAPQEAERTDSGMIRRIAE